MYLYICISLSLSIYIYIYIYTCVYISPCACPSRVGRQLRPISLLKMWISEGLTRALS